ncbi:MAG: ABC transporter ATP-binding protein [Phycisphaerae bacterium]|nr:ABC transporter ATP-binding protein [Tepidisphaeraceae bacterium]
MPSAPPPPLDYLTPRPPTGPVFRRLLGLLVPWRGMIAVSIVLLLVAGVCEIFPAFVWKYVADDVATNKPSSPMVSSLASLGGRITDPYLLVLSAVVWLLGIYIVGEVLGTVETNLLGRVTQQFIRRLRNQVYHKLQAQSLSYLQRQRTGDLMSRALSDVEELQSFITNGIDQILGEGIIWIVTVCVVMYMDWRVASISLAPLVFVFILLRVFNARVKPIYAAARERLGDVSNRLQENLAGVVVIKIFGREKAEAERFEQATAAHYDQQVKSINARSLYFPFARTVGFLSNVFMIGVGGYFLIKERDVPGGFTLGTLVMFRAYWWRLFGPINTLARVNDMVQRATAAGRRVFEVLDAPDELPDPPAARMLATVKGELALRHVDFAYETEEKASEKSEAKGQKPGASESSNGDTPPPHHTTTPSLRLHPVLHDISLTIPQGRTVALCGPSGSGKSTILSLLLRFYDPTAGSVTLDGVDVRSVTKDSLRRHFALVQQESFLFNDSIVDNIRYGHAEATMEQVIAAAKAANAHEFITRLPDGYDTKVGERGVRLSGGQKQRISIARAFLADPQILLLDEPTSSVEPDSEATIIAALGRLMAGRTTVVTSHRPSLILKADYAYVLEGGRVVEQGVPDELRDGDGWFARFIRSASEGAALDERS